MALLDRVLGNLTGGGDSPLQGVLSSLLGGGDNQAGGMGGGIGGLLSRFQQAGLGHVAQSWIGTGPNQPVSPQQLQTVFGDDQVQSMANQSGLAPHDFLSQLSQHLPRAVDGMTPDGQVPREGTMSV